MKSFTYHDLNRHAWRILHFAFIGLALMITSCWFLL
jgi:hypothetical protein